VGVEGLVYLVDTEGLVGVVGPVHRVDTVGVEDQGVKAEKPHLAGIEGGEDRGTMEGTIAGVEGIEDSSPD